MILLLTRCFNLDVRIIIITEYLFFSMSWEKKIFKENRFLLRKEKKRKGENRWSVKMIKIEWKKKKESNGFRAKDGKEEYDLKFKKLMINT